MKSLQRILSSALICLSAACSNEPTPGSAATESAAPEAEHGEIALISSEAAAASGIELRSAEAAMLHESIPLYGVIVPNAQRTRNVAARYAGIVRTVAVTTGERVKAGDTLARIESNDSLQTYPVTAPIAGIITARNVNPGEAVAEQTLFTLTDLSTVWVELAAFPRERAKVRTGQAVRVKSADGGLTDSGHIIFVSPLGNAATQSTTARVSLDNAHGRWTPGLYVSADVTLQEVSVPIAVQSQALQNLEGERVVFVPVDGGFAPRPVRSGRSDGATTEILDGLAAGERYVSTNSFVVKSELAKAAGHEH